MDKPLVLEMRDVKIDMINLVNNAIQEKKLPAYLVRCLVEEVYQSLRDSERTEMAAVERAYQENLAKENS